MTKTKIFTLSIMTLLGGFVLSTPFDALAIDLPDYTLPDPVVVGDTTTGVAIQNAYDPNVREAIKIKQSADIAASNASSKEEQTQIYEGAREAINNLPFYDEKQLFDENVREDVQKFIDERLVLVGQDGKIVKKNQAVTKNIEEKEKEVNELAKQYTDALDKATKGCSSTQSWFASLFPDKTKVLHTILGKSYSWSYHVEEILSGLSCDSTPERLAAIKEAKDLGQLLDNVRHEYQYLEKLGDHRGNVYSYYFCPKYKEDKKTCATELAHFDFIINEDDGTLRSITGTSQGCVPLPFKIYEAKSCLICPLMDIIYNAIQTASTSSFNKLGKPLSTLVLIGLSIWIAFMVLQNVSSMTKQDAPKFLTDLFKNSFKVIIIYFLLRDSKLVYGIIIGPILKAGFELGTSFLSVKLSSIEGCSANLLTIGSGGAAGVLPQYIYANINCFIRAVQFELATSQAIGSSLMCVSMHQAKGNLSAIAKVLPDFTMMFTGGLIYIISFIMMLGFGFYLIDATVQLGIFGTVLPFLLLCWPFEKTNKNYFQTGVKVFMNSWFIYVFMGIVVNICMNLIGQSLTGGKGGFSDIQAAINGNDVRELQKLLDIGYSGFLILVACCVMSIKLMQKVEDLAGKFSGGFNLGIGAKVGGLATSGATGGAKAAVGFVGNRLKGAANAKVWGKEGSEKSIADMWRSGKHAAGRSIARGIQNRGKDLGRFLGGLGGHRN